VSDLINGLFELLGSALIWLNVHQLHHDKEFKGVHVAPTAFFFTWGLWNLYYYPSLGQWLSFAGGLSIVVANGVWVGQMLYYSRSKERLFAHPPARP
jgi:hypothetical protein